LSHMWAARESIVSRYFFSVRWPDRVDGDMLGTSLTDDNAALAHAIEFIRELKHRNEYNDPRIMMVVRNEKLKTVLSLPFFAGCA
jgi:hypothetical protein